MQTKYIVGRIPHTNSISNYKQEELRNSYEKGAKMKATGIVRRIHDLGRIVIPKEIRRTMRIREGDPMEIFTSREGEILLKKYSPVGELSEFAVSLAESLSQTMGELVCITDRDYVIAAAGSGKKDYDGKLLDAQMQGAIDKRMNAIATAEKNDMVKITADDEKKYVQQAIATILANGDSIGAVIILSKEKGRSSEELLLQIVKTAAAFLGRHLEQ
jgi:AbrB family transcriptional regulator (stage V sporulation protein T)